MDARTMQQAERNNGRSFCAGAWSLLCHHPDTMVARYIYAVLLLFGLASASWLRANPKEFYHRQRISGCNGNRDCLASEAVLIISLAYFLFHSFMFLTTVCTRNIHDFRNSWHSGWWPVKLFLLVVCLVISSLVPSHVLKRYGKAADFGAGVFLFIQHISVIRYITRLNSKWCGHENFQNYEFKVNMVSVLGYVCSIVGIELLVLFYVRCCVNAVFVVATVVLVILMPVFSLLNKANNGFYMEPAILGVYVVFLSWSAIKSEPEAICDKKEETGSGANWITITGFVGGVISVAVSAFSTGKDYKCIQFGNAVPSGNEVPYAYGLFHLVFATSSMYFAMLFLGWDTHHPTEMWSIDVGWTSTVVHLVNAGLIVISFVAIMIARRYGIGWLEQLLGEIFGIGGHQQHAVDESRAPDDPERPGTDNNGSPREPASTEREGTETGNNGSLEEQERTEMGHNGPPQAPRAIELVVVGTERDDDDAQPSSSSSTTGPLPISVPQVPVLESQSEVEEEWRRDEQPSSSSSTTGPLEPQVPVLRRRQWAEIKEEW